MPIRSLIAVAVTNPRSLRQSPGPLDLNQGSVRLRGPGVDKESINRDEVIGQA